MKQHIELTEDQYESLKNGDEVQAVADGGMGDMIIVSPPESATEE